MGCPLATRHSRLRPRDISVSQSARHQLRPARCARSRFPAFRPLSSAAVAGAWIADTSWHQRPSLRRLHAEPMPGAALAVRFRSQWPAVPGRQGLGLQWGLTIHSSRTRFASRFNSGVSPFMPKEHRVASYSRVLALMLCVLWQPSYSAVPGNSGPELTPEQMKQLDAIRAERAAAQERLRSAQQTLLRIWVQRTQESIKSNWAPPLNAAGLPECEATLLLSDTGVVESVIFETPCATQDLQASIEAAVMKSSPLHPPNFPWEKRVVLHFVALDGG
jgi:hypothetical protein